jgi:hypothetical protein
MVGIKFLEIKWADFLKLQMKRLRLFVVLFCLGFIFPGKVAFAEALCGKYEMKGFLRMQKTPKNQFVYVVNEGTQSERRFVIESFAEIKKVSGFLNQPTQLTVEIKKPMDGTLGWVDQVLFIRLRKPNPLLHGGDTGAQLLQARVCY